MKRGLLIILFFFYSNFLFSQEFEQLCDSILKFTNKAEFDAIECDIFYAVGHILSQTYDENKSDNNYAMESLEHWMKGTKNYHLITGGKILEDCDKGDVTMKNIFKVCMIDFLFANHEYVESDTKNGVRYVNINKIREIIYGGAQLFMEYLSKQDKKTNNKVLNKELKKGLKLYQEGKLDEYMES